MKKRAAPSTENLESNCRPRKQIRYKKRRENFPPQFWESLSKVWLTPRALRELDRRNAARPLLASRPPPVSASSSPSRSTVDKFAQHGGPDLCHLRGYLDPTCTAEMPTSLASTVTPDSRMTKRSSTYDSHFEECLGENKIFTEEYHRRSRRSSTPEPENLDDIVQALSNPRASLSPTRVPSSAFQAFKRANSQVISKASTMKALLSAIQSKDCSHDADHGLRFTRLDSITNRTTVDPVPDMHDGSRPSSLHKSVQDNLGHVIAPTRHFNALVLPNFFLEVRAPEGGFEVVKRQACLDGAVGARAMHALQNYGAEKPVYDGNAYSFSCVYHAGTATLHLYAHYPTAPLTEGDAPEFHMKKVDAFFMTKNHHDFVAAVTAFKNVRDLAKKYRKRFIEAANARASGKSQPLAEVGEAAVAVDAVDAVDVVDDVGPFNNVEPLNKVGSLRIVGPVNVYSAGSADHAHLASHANPVNSHHSLHQVHTLNKAHTVENVDKDTSWQDSDGNLQRLIADSCDVEDSSVHADGHTK